MRLIFHGQLRELYGPEAVMHADTVASAVEGFSRQNADWPKDMLVEVVGYDRPELLKEHAEEIHLMPAMCGGGGKFGSILLGAAMVGLTFLPGAGQLLQGIMIGLKSSLIIAGGMLMLQGVMGLFMKAPKMKKNQDPEASKYLGINKNTTEIGTPITMAWGQINLSGHWLSLQSDSTNLSYGSFPVNPT